MAYGESSVIGYKISESFSLPSEKKKLRSSLKLEIVARIVSANMYEYWICMRDAALLCRYSFCSFSIPFHAPPDICANHELCVHAFFQCKWKKHLKHSTQNGTEPNRIIPEYRLHLHHICTTEQWNEIYFVTAIAIWWKPTKKSQYDEKLLTSEIRIFGTWISGMN